MNIAAVVVAFAFGVLVRDVAQDWRDTREASVPQKVASPSDARIWSKKCERAGKRVLAKQADGGKWELRCIDPDVRT